jgi:Rib/alpha/Esp surface antigen-like repeat protein
VKVQDVTVYEGGEVTLEDLLVEATDLAGEVTTKLLQQVDTAVAGTYTVTLEATDPNGNKTTVDCTVTVRKDEDAPVFSGLKDLTTAKGKKPNYTTGVTATDARDGKVDFTYDDSKVDLTKAGTYYVTYTAVDKSGNTVSSRRKVVVDHDQADTDALVQRIAAGLSDDAEKIRDYVRDSIKYSHDWGGEDPVWFGFNTKKGNCYVHALCLQVLLEAKGYETNLIWVTDKSHYWIQVKIDGVWKHIDATPGTRHTKYSLMNDAQRLETLQGRHWDTSKWPACK